MCWFRSPKKETPRWNQTHRVIEGDTGEGSRREEK